MDNNVENENDVEDNDIEDNAHPKRWGSMSLNTSTRSKRVIIDDVPVDLLLPILLTTIQ